MNTDTKMLVSDYDQTFYVSTLIKQVTEKEDE